MIIAASIYLVSTSAYIFVFRKALLFDPVSWFLFFQAIMFVGSVEYLDLSLRADLVHVYVMVISQVGVILGATYVDLTVIGKNNVVKRFKGAQATSSDYCGTIAAIANFICVVSIIVSSIYYSAIGYNYSVVAIRALLSGTLLHNAGELRRFTYTGESYFAPGYVNQFKNILFPLMITYLMIKSRLSDQKQSKVVLFLYIPLSFYFITGTGQRAALIYALVTSIIFINLSFTNKDRRKFTLLLFLLMFSGFMILTVFLGRDFQSFGEIDVFSILASTVSRVFDANQLSSVIGFRYVFDMPHVYGGEWLDDLKLLLPGKPDHLPIAHLIHGVLYGTTAGTAPLSIWGSIWYNFGMLGVIVLSVGIGTVFRLIFFRMLRAQKTIERMVYYALLISVIGRWNAGGPITLIQTGLGVVILLKLLFWLTKKSRLQLSMRQTMEERNAEIIDPNARLQ
jgi:hypothetical protein